MVMIVVPVQPFVSVAVIVYVPAVTVNEPPLMVVVIAPVPPAVDSVIVLVPPKHTMDVLLAVTETAVVVPTVAVAVAKH
jgi:hypothetical protein